MNILITGASSGIGKTIYEELQREYTCIGLSRRGPDLKVDITALPSKSVIDDLPLYALINCAGIMPLEDYPKSMAVNFFGTYYMIENIYDNLVDGACIINIASVSGMEAEPMLPIYAASKAAVISLTKSLALKYADRKIRVNCVSPGFYDTALVPFKTPKELLDTVPFGYEDDPQGLVNIIRAILETPYMTGANIVVDGGVSL